MQSTPYALPPFHEDDLYEPKVQHRLNFFGQTKNTQERIHLLLSINQSVFADDCAFTESVLALCDDGITKPGTTARETIPPRERYSERLTDYMRTEALSDHHIIFNNRHLQGHPAHKDNIIPLARGPHTSLHELLERKNLYPHQQLIKILALEKETLYPEFLGELQHLQTSYDILFRTNPHALYKHTCFHPLFRRKTA